MGHPNDLCRCGDYRRDHKDGTGACCFNGNGFDLTHGSQNCLKFVMADPAGLSDAPPRRQAAAPVPHDLAKKLTGAIDEWREAHPDVTVTFALTALEIVRDVLTEAWVRPAGSQRNHR